MHYLSFKDNPITTQTISRQSKIANPTNAKLLVKSLWAMTEQIKRINPVKENMTVYPILKPSGILLCREK